MNRSSTDGDDAFFKAIRKIDILAHCLCIGMTGKWARLIVKSLENADGYKANVRQRWEEDVNESMYTTLHLLDIMAAGMPLGTLLMFLIHTLMTPEQESLSYMRDAVDHLYRNPVDCITGVRTAGKPSSSHSQPTDSLAN